MWMDGWLCKSFVHPLILQEGDPQYCSLFRLKLPSPILPVSKEQCLLEYKSPLMHLQPGLKGPNLKSKKKKKSAPKALAACQQFPTLGANQCIFTFQLMYRQLPIPVEVLRIFPCSCRLFRNRKQLAADPILEEKNICAHFKTPDMTPAIIFSSHETPFV